MPKPTKPYSSRVTPARAVAIVLTLSALGVLTGCRAGTSVPDQTEIIGGVLFQLQNGRFSPLPKEGQPSVTPLQPWTVQERVSGLVALGERVYLGVNGQGIAELIVAADGEADFNYFYDPLIFRYRTLTTLIPERGPGRESLLCHLYFNKLLNVVSEEELKLQGISLLRLIPSTGIYAFLTPPYQEAHPEWEAVGFVPVTPREFYMQWKYSDRNRTLFSYSRFDPAELIEEEVGALSYRKSYGFREIREGGALKVLLAETRRLLDAPGISTAYQLYIRYEDQPLMRRYEHHPADFTSAEELRLYTLSGINRDELFLLLLPDGLLLQGTSGSRKIQRLRLPTLPEGYVYRDLFLYGRYLLASWEQTAFTNVGAAGVFFAAVTLIP